MSHLVCIAQLITEHSPMLRAHQNVHTPMECPPSVRGGDCTDACRIKQSNATRSILCGAISRAYYILII
jgi:hypothetical protein